MQYWYFTGTEWNTSVCVVFQPSDLDLRTDKDSVLKDDGEQEGRNPSPASEFLSNTGKEAAKISSNWIYDLYP